MGGRGGGGGPPGPPQFGGGGKLRGGGGNLGIPLPGGPLHDGGGGGGPPGPVFIDIPGLGGGPGVEDQIRPLVVGALEA